MVTLNRKDTFYNITKRARCSIYRRSCETHCCPATLVSNIHREVWLVHADLTCINYITSCVRWSTIKAWIFNHGIWHSANDITSQQRLYLNPSTENEAGFLHPHLHHVLFSSSARSAEGCTMRTRTCQMWRKSQTSGLQRGGQTCPAIHTTANLSVYGGKRLLFLCVYILISAINIHYNLKYWGFCSPFGHLHLANISCTSSYSTAHNLTLNGWYYGVVHPKMKILSLFTRLKLYQTCMSFCFCEHEDYIL